MLKLGDSPPVKLEKHISSVWLVVGSCHVGSEHLRFYQLIQQRQLFHVNPCQTNACGKGLAIRLGCPYLGCQKMPKGAPGPFHTVPSAGCCFELKYPAQSDHLLSAVHTRKFLLRVAPALRSNKNPYLMLSIRMVWNNETTRNNQKQWYTNG